MPPPSRKLGWGVLGFAKIARENVIPAIVASSNGEFRALASRTEAKLGEVRARYPGVTTSVGYDALLEDPAVDAVYIPLPNSEHCAWTIRAAERGKHVLCEKPIALNAAEARRMVAACAANRVTLMEAFMYRYSERTRLVLETVRSGALGRIKHVNSSFRFLLANPASIKLKPELGGGALYDVGCYPVNFAGMIADAVGEGPGTARPDSVAVECVREGGVDMLFSALLRYPSGMIAALHTGLNAFRRVHSEIIGTEGILEIPETFFGTPGSLTLTTAAGSRTLPVVECDRYRLEV